MSPRLSKLATIHGDARTRSITIGGHIELDPAPSMALINHSPDGFNWGYEGSGPAQLALALLLHFASAKFALDHYQEFKRNVIAGFTQDQDFDFPVRRVLAWITHTRKGEKDGTVMYETLADAAEYRNDDDSPYAEDIGMSGYRPWIHGVQDDDV